jgi:uncharacterized protein (TIGR04255 family)
VPFPESPRVIYKKNPLVEVICQIRFPPILRITSGGVADFQEKLRERYPLYELQEQPFDLAGVPKDLVSFMEQLFPKTPGPRTHKFLTEDSKRFISLSQDFMALSIANYTRWEYLRDQIVTAEAALRGIYKPAFYSRVGLRYRDVLSPIKLGFGSTEWDKLVGKHILGELGDPSVGKAVRNIRTQCVIELKELTGGRVTITHGLYKDVQSGETCYLIDADFAVERKEATDEVFTILDKFNRLAGRLFRWAITENLHNALEPESI